MMLKCALVCDDRHEDQVLAREQLVAGGWEVFTASKMLDSYRLITAWLAPNAISTHKTVVLLDLVMDAHALHLAALVSDLQQRGVLLPAPIVAVTARLSAENMRLARVAGCAASYEKPLTPDLVAELERLEPAEIAQLSQEEGWMREWLISEGRRLLRSQLARHTLADYGSSPEEVEVLLKILSGRGWRPKQPQATEVLRKFGGEDHARSIIGGLLPFLSDPSASLLRYLLSGSSIEESGKQLGYCRSHAYQLFEGLLERLSQLLMQSQELVLQEASMLDDPLLELARDR